MTCSIVAGRPGGASDVILRQGGACKGSTRNDVAGGVMVGGGVGALARARPCSRQRGATCVMQGGAGVRRTCWPPHTVVLYTWRRGGRVHRIGVPWEGLAPLRGFLTRPQMVPATGKVGGSAADLQEGGLVGVVEWVLETGGSEHLGRVHRGGW